MRRLLRILLNAATVLSLIACSASCILWVESYRRCGHWETPRRRPFDWSLAEHADMRSDPRLWWVQWRVQWCHGRFAVIRTDQPFFEEEMTETLALVIEPSGIVSVDRGIRGFCYWDVGSIHHVRHTRTIEFFQNGRSVIAGTGVWFLEFPAWMPTVAGSLLPMCVSLVWVTRHRRQRSRRASGRCIACGYDCRATAERCPECGTAVVTAATPAREGKGETEGV
jgi:hypothetical protein